MIQKIKNILLSFSALFILAVPLAAPVVAPATVSAAEIQKSLCSGAVDLSVSGSSTCANTAGDEGAGKVNKLITQIVNILSIIVGVVAVIMIIIGGFRYITSGGKEEGVKGAKNTILYALIGLVVVALAQIIVKFVLNKATT